MKLTTRPEALIFDVNETLLDLSKVQDAFSQAFQNDYAFKYWFQLLLHYSLVDTLTGQFHDFKQIGEAVLSMTEEFFGHSLSAEKKQTLLQTMVQIDPHPDVEQGLSLLKEAGFRLFTLTNSPDETLKKQMEATGLDAFFEATWTVNAVKRYKPHPDTYGQVLRKLDLRPDHTMLIAAHGWDIAGAAHVGMKTAFIHRKGQALYPLSSPPDLQGKTLIDLAHQLIRLPA
jgi:2-haloacid dehalogenase